MAKAKKPRGGSVQKWLHATESIGQASQRKAKILELAKGEGFSVQGGDVETWLSRPPAADLPEELKSELQEVIAKCLASDGVQLGDVLRAVKETNRGATKAKKFIDEMPLFQLEALLEARRKAEK